jgi:cysteine synthase
MNKNKKLNKLKKSDLVDLLIKLRESNQSGSAHYRNAYVLLKTAKY